MRSITEFPTVFGPRTLHPAVGWPTTPLMDPSSALLAGVVAGLAIALQIGAVSLLLIETAATAGPRVGAAAGLGVATADLAFATAAASAGSALSGGLARHESQLRIVAAVVLALAAGRALYGMRRTAGPAAGGDADPSPAVAPGPAAVGPIYARFLAITAANPLTIVSFVAVAAALSLDGPTAAGAFVLGVAGASTVWHLVLTVAVGHAGRRITPGLRRGLAVAGRLGVLAIAARLALSTLA